MVTRRSYIIAFAQVAILLAAAAGGDPGPETSIPSLQAYLAEFSGVLDVDDDRGREFVSTRLTDPGSAFVLVYERRQYDSVETPTPSTRQIIHYPFAFSNLSPSSMEVREWAGPLSGRPYYIVLATVEPEKQFIEYTNIVETRLEDGSVDVTSSRGKARSLALGYFRQKETAQKFADAFRDVLLRDAGRKPASPDSEVAPERG